MRKAWFINLEDVIGPQHAVPALEAYFLRYLPLVEAGDLFISPVKLDAEFAAYVRRLKKLPSTAEWLVEPEYAAKPYSLCAAVRGDACAMARLREFGQAGGVLWPFMQTAPALELAEACGLGWQGSMAEAVRSGYTIKLNDKRYFKTVSAELGIPAVPGFAASSAEEITEAVGKINIAEPGRDIMLKRVLSGGGYGNQRGSAEQVLKIAKAWPDGEPVLVEPYENFTEVCGTLVLISDDSCRFIGADRQFIHNSAWRGCEYPCALPERIRQWSLAYADTFRASGARGYANIDWGMRETGGPLAIECNFRLNGFSHILEIAERVFGLPPKTAKIKFVSEFPVKKDLSLPETADRLNADFKGQAFCLPLGLPRGGFAAMFFASATAEGISEIERESETGFQS